MSQFQNSTVREMASNSMAELAHEQAYLTMLYEHLDVLKTTTDQRLAEVRLGPTAENDQGWSERESIAQLYQDRAAELEAAERNLCFGRLDFDDGDRFYIGRLGLRSDDYEQVLVDWRARAAESFYRATPRERYGVTRRRHLHTADRRVVSLDDDVLDLDAVDENHLAGEAALLASLRRGRTGRMGDIVATIQADQDRIIRADPGGILVVEGGPGTGKTVVALHRAAYLLYTHRRNWHDAEFWSSARTPHSCAISIRCCPRWARMTSCWPPSARCFLVSRPAARNHRRPPGSKVTPRWRAFWPGPSPICARYRPIEIKVDGTAYRLTPRICGDARAEAGQRLDPDTGARLPHNTARRVFINAVLRRLARQGARDFGSRRIRPSGDAEDLRAELAAAPAILSVLDVLWPEFTPQQLLTQLYQAPSRLDLTDGERAAIARDAPGPWTPADVPLLDELAELLGPLAATEMAAKRRRAAAEAERAEEVQYAAELVAQLAADEAIVLPPLETDTFVTWIADRNTESGPSGMLAERALHDRNWAYGHVIVDEAQELSAMAWRMVLRHCPARSMTVVGDLAQTGTPGGADSWGSL